MKSYDGPGSSNDSTYKYDAFARRITKDVNGAKTAYFHDFLDVVAEYNGSNQLQRTYVTPGLDQNLTMTASGSTYYYLTDALGSIRQLIDANEATQNAYDYYAFGKVYGTPTENLTQPFRFTGRAWDPESSLYYYRMRNYRAEIGLFLSRDPLGYRGSANLFAYVGNRPTFWRDPLGLSETWAWDDWWDWVALPIHLPFDMVAVPIEGVLEMGNAMKNAQEANRRREQELMEAADPGSDPRIEKNSPAIERGAQELSESAQEIGTAFPGMPHTGPVPSGVPGVAEAVLKGLEEIQRKEIEEIKRRKTECE